MNEDLQSKCREYIESRTSNYEFRCIRLKAVGDKLSELGLSAHDTIVDVGAGRMDFCKYMRSRGWVGEYIPIDGLLDGTDLNFWEPRTKQPYFVAIEIVEHVHDPARLMRAMVEAAKKGVVATTPNSETVDVIGCDPTHVSVIPPEMWKAHGWNFERVSLFMSPEDSLLAWKTK